MQLQYQDLHKQVKNKFKKGVTRTVLLLVAVRFSLLIFQHIYENLKVSFWCKIKEFENEDFFLWSNWNKSVFYLV